MKTVEEKFQVIELHPAFDELQDIYGSKELTSIYGAGCVEQPEVCFIFMNPTGKNVASAKDWHGLKAQWLGTKNIWKLFYSLHLIDEETNQEIQKMKASEWTYSFSEKLYSEIAEKKYYITNLGKCTQVDARPLPDKVFREYLQLLENEIELLRPKVIVTFGNQVSSIFLGQEISVSKCRKQYYDKKIGNHSYKVYPVYYPVGQGMRNIPIAIEDISEILKKETKIL